MTTKLKQSDLARELGVSQSMVSRLARQGMPMHDVSAAHAWRALHLDPARVKTARVDGQCSASNPHAERPRDPACPRDVTDEEPDYTGDAVTDFRIARAMRERENARLAQLERMKIEGELCLVEDVKREAYTNARRLRDTLLGALPTRLAPHLAQLCGDAFALEQALREGLRAALVDLAGAMGSEQI